MNQNPQVLFVDPAPCSSTAAAALSMQQANILDKALVPADFEALANRSFWLETFYLSRNQDLQQPIWKKSGPEISPNIVSGGSDPIDIMSATWHDIKACHSTYGYACYNYTFVHLGTNEVKGKIRFDFYNFIVRHVNGEPGYDLSRERNTHCFWDLESSNACTISICPIANAYSFKRVWRLDDEIFVGPDTGAPRQVNFGTRDNRRPFDYDIASQGSVRATLDEGLVYPSMFPDEIPVLVFLKINYTITTNKSHLEPIGAVAFPPKPANG